jgi:hypothetical protein
MKNLAEHLREQCDGTSSPIYMSRDTLLKSADRIEKLEAALREILSLGSWGANPLARTIALEALEEKDENP